MIEVHTSTHLSYPVILSKNALADAAQHIKKRFPASRLFVVIDSKVARLYGDFIQRWISFVTTEDYCWYEVPEGEGSKNWQQTAHLVDYLLHQSVKRDDLILAFGGGVVGDLAGFAASIALRGVPVMHFPTTLLAMVDSAIGGKTGINHETGKNRIGTFYQPEAVIAHTPFLETLDSREWLCGFGEIIKYACIASPALFPMIETHIQQKEVYHPDFLTMLSTCAAIKASIVSEDEREQGKRAYLNFGHTFGHAIEAELGYGEMSHGAAIVLGMIAAAYASEKVFKCELLPVFSSLIPLYQSEWKELSPYIDAMLERMQFDKKNTQSGLRFILLKQLGEPVIHAINDAALVRDAFQYANAVIR